MHMPLKVIHQLPVAATAKILSTTDAPQRPVVQRGKTKGDTSGCDAKRCCKSLLRIQFSADPLGVGKE